MKEKAGEKLEKITALAIILMLFLSTLLLSPSVPLVSADRGMIPVAPDVSIFEPGQRPLLRGMTKKKF